MGRDHNYTSILTLPESRIEEAVGMYVAGGLAGVRFGKCTVLGVRLERCGPETGIGFQAHVTLQTGGFHADARGVAGENSAEGGSI